MKSLLMSSLPAEEPLGRLLQEYPVPNESLRSPCTSEAFGKTPDHPQPAKGFAGAGEIFPAGVWPVCHNST